MRLTRDTSSIIRGAEDARVVVFPKPVRRVEGDAFQYTQSLRQVVLNDGLEELGIGCFCQSGIEATRIPDSVVEVAEKAFYSCLDLRSVALGEGSRLEKIGHDAFGATGLEPSSLGPVSRAAL